MSAQKTIFLCTVQRCDVHGSLARCKNAGFSVVHAISHAWTE